MARKKRAARGSVLSPDRYTYILAPSGDPNLGHVGLVREFPSLSWLASTRAGALEGIKKLVGGVLLDMEMTMETPPVPGVEIPGTVDRVNHPSHYTRGGIEAIDVIEAWQLNFHTGNALKYLSRCGHKDGVDPLEDLSKAVWYLNREIARRTKET